MGDELAFYIHFLSYTCFLPEGDAVCENKNFFAPLDIFCAEIQYFVMVSFPLILASLFYGKSNLLVKKIQITDSNLRKPFGRLQTFFWIFKILYFFLLKSNFFEVFFNFSHRYI